MRSSKGSAWSHRACSIGTSSSDVDPATAGTLHMRRVILNEKGCAGSTPCRWVNPVYGCAEPNPVRRLRSVIPRTGTTPVHGLTDRNTFGGGPPFHSQILALWGPLHVQGCGGSSPVKGLTLCAGWCRLQPCLMLRSAQACARSAPVQGPLERGTMVGIPLDHVQNRTCLQCPVHVQGCAESDA